MKTITVPDFVAEAAEGLTERDWESVTAALAEARRAAAAREALKLLDAMPVNISENESDQLYRELTDES